MDDDTLLLIERDNQRGDDAKIKKITRVELSGVTPVAAGESRPVFVKQTVLDLIPALRAGGVVAADKPEGLAITGRGELIGAVDNDGLDDAPGESVLLRLGRAPVSTALAERLAPAGQLGDHRSLLLLRGVGLEVLLLGGFYESNPVLTSSQVRWSLVLWNPWFILGGVAFALASLTARGR